MFFNNKLDVYYWECLNLCTVFVSSLHQVVEEVGDVFTEH